MELFIIISLAVIFAAAIIGLEIKVAKMNRNDIEEGLKAVCRMLEKMGATDVTADGKGGFHFMLEDECFWLNLTNAPITEIILQNSIEGCPDTDVAEQIARELSSQLAGGKVVIKDGSIYCCWTSIMAGEDALEQGLPLLLDYLFHLRESFLNIYGKQIAAKTANKKTLLS